MSQGIISDPDVLERVRELRQLQMQAESAELEFFTMARARGWTWKLIAAAMDWNSPQAAQQRHARLQVIASRRREKFPAHLR